MELKIDELHLLHDVVNIGQLKIDGFIHKDNWPEILAPLRVQSLCINIADRAKDMSFFDPEKFLSLQQISCFVSNGEPIEGIIDVFSKLPNLTQLILNNTILKNKDFQKLAQLIELNLMHCIALDHIENFIFPNLTKLNVSYTTNIITNETLHKLPATLLNLEMPCSGITDIAGLQFLPNIKYLRINSNNIVNFSPIQYLTNLQDLDVSFTTDDTYSSLLLALNGIHLHKLECWGFMCEFIQFPQSIKILDIAYSNINDSQLLLLSQHLQLEILNINNCKNISMDGIYSCLLEAHLFKKISMKNIMEYTYAADLKVKHEYSMIEFITDYE